MINNFTFTTDDTEKVVSVERTENNIISKTTIPDIIQEYKDGKKIALIKRQIDATGQTLREAKAAIEEVIMPSKNIISQTTIPDIVREYKNGKKVHLVRRQRQATGQTLREAKAAIEEVMSQESSTLNKLLLAKKELTRRIESERIENS